MTTALFDLSANLGKNSLHILPPVACASRLFSVKPVDVSEGADEIQAAPHPVPTSAAVVTSSPACRRIE